MSDYLNKIVYLSKEQYQSLLDSTSDPKSIQVNGTTYQYDANSLYITNDKGDADTVNGHSVYHDVPFDAVFTDTNVYHTSGGWTNLTYTAQTIGGTGNASQYELSFTLPTTLNANFILQRTDDTLLGINTTTYQIGTNIKSLHFNQVKGNGTDLTNGNGGGITFGNGSNSYGGMYWQTSGNYGSRLYFATTTSFANGAYARMIITPAGYVGIGKLDPSTLLDVNGTVTATSFSGNLSGNASTSTSWANARKVYAALGTASTTTTINGGASDAAAIGIGIDGTLGINNGGTGITTTDPHTVLIGPSSGSTAAAPTWRTIAASDLPTATSDSLGAVIIGSGITNNNGTISVTASNLGLSQALKFVGITNTDMTGGTATNNLYTGVPGGITSYTTPAIGDVVINNTNNDEWVCTIANGASSKWERLGSDTSYKIVQTVITDNTGTADSTDTSTSFIYSFSQDANGVVSVKTRTLNTNGTWNGNAKTATTASALKNINANTGSGNRPTNVNTAITHVNNGGVQHIKIADSTNSITGHLLHFHWDTGDSWDGQLLLPNNSSNSSMKWRSCTAANTWGSWRTLLDSNNYTDYLTTAKVQSLLSISASGSTTKWLNEQGGWTTPTASDIGAAPAVTGGYLPLSGGDVTGQIYKSTITNSLWKNGRDKALIAIKEINDAYFPAISMKTTSGSWDIGTYDNNTWKDQLLFTYIKDSTYNGTNKADKQIKFADDGTIYADTFSGDLSGNASTASKLTDITTTDAATSSDTWRYVWFSYNDNTTGRPAYKDTIAFQTSTNTLKSGKYLIGEHVKLEYNSTDNSLDFIFI